MPVTLKYELRTNKARKDGTCPIALRVTFKRVKAYLFTGYYCHKSSWNLAGSEKQENWVNRKETDFFMINKGLGIKYKKAQAVIMKLEIEEREITIPVLKELIEKFWLGIDSEKKRTLHSYLREEIEIRKVVNLPTALQLETILSNLIDFQQDIELLEVDLFFLERFEAFLLKTLKPSTIGKRMAFLKTLFSKAVDRGFIDAAKNPFNKFRIRNVKVLKEKLSIDQIKAIEELNLTNDSQIHAKHIFLFQYYTAGTRVADVLNARWCDIEQGRFNYVMAKTGTRRSILLNDKALRIIEYYRVRSKNTSPMAFIFPFLDNSITKEIALKFHKQTFGGPTAMVNKGLKVIAEKVGIHFSLTSHVARHTFADHARRASGDVYVVSQALGHANLGITETYLKGLESGEVDGVIKLLEEKNG